MQDKRAKNKYFEAGSLLILIPAVLSVGVAAAVASALFMHHLLSMSIIDLVKHMALFTAPILISSVIFLILLPILNKALESSVNKEHDKEHDTAIAFVSAVAPLLSMPLVFPLALAAMHHISLSPMPNLQQESIAFFAATVLLLSLLAIKPIRNNKAGSATIAIGAAVSGGGYVITSLMQAANIMAAVSGSRLLLPLTLTSVVVVFGLFVGILFGILISNKARPNHNHTSVGGQPLSTAGHMAGWEGTNPHTGISPHSHQGYHQETLLTPSQPETDNNQNGPSW
jgi:hypothetical protein